VVPAVTEEIKKAKAGA